MSPSDYCAQQFAIQQEIEKRLKRATAGQFAKVTGNGPTYHYVRSSFGRSWFWVQIFSGEAITTEQLAARCVKFGDTVELINVIRLEDLRDKKAD